MWPLEGAYKGSHEVYVTVAGGLSAVCPRMTADVRARQSWMWDVRGELPEELKGMSGAEQKAFYARLQTERGEGSMPWKTVRAALISQLTTQRIHAFRQEVEGKFLPLSVWVAQGWDEETVKKQPCEWSEQLQAWTYQVAVKCITWSDTYEKIEKRILEHERNAHQKKGKAKADEAEMDLPALAGKDGGEAAGKGDKNQERTGKKHLAANQKANQAAAKAMPLLASSLQAMEKMEPKLPQIAGEEGYEEICKTFRETKEKLVAWSTAARQTLAEYDRTKNDAPATMTLIPALPFSLGQK